MLESKMHLVLKQVQMHLQVLIYFFAKAQLLLHALAVFFFLLPNAYVCMDTYANIKAFSGRKRPKNE